MTGRLDDMINCHGNKISPSKVEQALRGHGGIRDICVFRILLGKTEQCVGAALVLDKGAQLCGREILKSCVSAGQLPVQVRGVYSFKSQLTD